MNQLLAARVRMVERSARVRRYHTEPVVHQQTVGEHTYGVMWLVYLLSDGDVSRNLLLAAMMHDAPEHETGDIPAPVKRTGGIKAMFDTLEDRAMRDLQLAFPELTEAEAATLKMADCLEGMLFCSWELKRGNTLMALSFRNYTDYIRRLQPQGVAAEIYNQLKGEYGEY